MSDLSDLSERKQQPHFKKIRLQQQVQRPAHLHRMKTPRVQLDDFKVENKCYPYKNFWVKPTYDVRDVSSKEAPIQVYTRKGRKGGKGSNFDLAAGVYQFILYLNDNGEMTLVTSYINPLEYGNKHAMMDYRVRAETPETFLFSGEFKLDGSSTILFHDTSSFSFSNDKHMIKRGAVSLFLEDYIRQNPGITFDALKRVLIDVDLPRKLLGAKDMEELQAMVARVPVPKRGVVRRYYRDEILANLLRYAFYAIFGMEVNLKFNENGGDEGLFQPTGPQFESDRYFDYLCGLTPPRNFDIYPTQSACERSERVLRMKSCTNGLTLEDFPPDQEPRQPPLLMFNGQPVYRDDLLERFGLPPGMKREKLVARLRQKYPDAEIE